MVDKVIGKLGTSDVIIRGIPTTDYAKSALDRSPATRL